ncbi:chemotaxis protein CheB [Histidinibacterium aquaticum]|uniref:protein-glutamate O-methyltransferase n=1 Tax=Histidinibacterium aquaticum TaxID=2613962 RepID=A0A5J5GKI9_9RHOB|nr:chemotaxis protein CheB [Histidinibacterium aquaticum]KAA9008148.1 PAS domain-containing protein [Histidinibacterium aquaticum]
MNDSPDTTGPTPASSPSSPLRLVGVAASAGGLEALSLLVQNLPGKANAAYIVAQHMSPTHKSLLTSLLSHETRLPAVEIDGDVAPEPDTIYVAPPNWDVVVEDGMIRLKRPSSHPATPKPSADRLFQSLAEEAREAAVGIVLSGTGSDGSYGVKSLREAGGITIAQSRETAKYDGMPASAVATGCIDLSLSPQQIGEHLQRILDRAGDVETLQKLDVAGGELSELLQILRAKTRVDFSDYKVNTVKRRILRRMTALGIEEYEDYVDHCRRQEEEVDILFRDLLISVTRFFRDPEQFEHLAREIERLVERAGDRIIRVWVAGCATGEEAYTIAILLAEALGGLEELTKERVQIFATDIDERALEVASRGEYPVNATQDIPERLADRYFDVDGNTMRVKRPLRAVTLFSRHNIFQDPPFIHLDLISLRNLLIYFNAPLQEKVLSRMLYALAPSGLLFLGTAESVANLDVRLEARTGADRVFAKRSGVAATQASFLTGSATLPTRQRNREAVSAEVEENALRYEQLVRSVAPTGFFATRQGRIVRILGDISPYIEITEKGALSLNTRMLRRPFRDEATSLTALTLKQRVRRAGRWHEFEPGTGDNRVQLECFPVPNQSGGEDLVLFSIVTRLDQPVERNVEGLSETEQRDYITRLENELARTRDALQQTVEQLQTSNEELQSVNEEMQSTNEELQATNEELETSNEELQSTNEELITVNEEMQVSAAELQSVSTELLAILAASPYVLLVVDTALIVRRASDRAKTFCGIEDLPPSGVHLGACRLPEGFPNLVELASEVLRTREQITCPAEASDSIYGLTVTPYFDSLGFLMGLTISTLEFDSRPFRATAERMWQLAGIAYWRLNMRTRALTFSPGVSEIYGIPPNEAAPSVEEAINYYHPDDRERVNAALNRCLDTGEAFTFEARLMPRGGGVRHVQSAGALVRDAAGEPSFVVGGFQDVSARIQNRVLIRNLEEVQDDFGIGSFSYDVENRRAYWTRGFYRLLGFDPERDEPTLDSSLMRVHREDRERVDSAHRATVETGEPFAVTCRILDREDETIWCDFRGRARLNDQNAVSHVYGSLRPLSEDEIRHHLEQADGD